MSSSSQHARVKLLSLVFAQHEIDYLLRCAAFRPVLEEGVDDGPDAKKLITAAIECLAKRSTEKPDARETSASGAARQTN
jgi:hypothetical protein